MGLKIAHIANFINKNGFSVDSLALSVKKVIFHYDELRAEIVYELTPSTYVSGMEKELASHSFPLDFNDMELVGLIMSASDALWQRNSAIPLLETVENGVAVKKSLAQLSAEISDVNL